MENGKIKQILKQDIKEIENLKEKNIKEIFFLNSIFSGVYSCSLCVRILNKSNCFIKTIREIQFKTKKGLDNFVNDIKDLNLDIKGLK